MAQGLMDKLLGVKEKVVEEKSVVKTVEAIQESVPEKPQRIIPEVVTEVNEDDPERLELAKEFGAHSQFFFGRYPVIHWEAMKKWLIQKGCIRCKENRDYHYNSSHFFNLDKYPGYLPKGILLQVKKLVGQGAQVGSFYVVDPDFSQKIDPLLVYHIDSLGSFLIAEWDKV